MADTELKISPDEKVAGVPLARLLRNLDETSYNEGSVDLACRLTDCKAVIEELLQQRALASRPAEVDDEGPTDAKRLMFAMQDVDGFGSLKQDKYDLAVVVMEERGLDEPDWECELEGVRRLIDMAMTAPSHTTNKEK